MRTYYFLINEVKFLGLKNNFKLLIMVKSILELGNVLSKIEQKVIYGGKKLVLTYCDNGTTCSVDSDCPESCKCDYRTSNGYKICF